MDDHRAFWTRDFEGEVDVLVASLAHGGKQPRRGTYTRLQTLFFFSLMYV